MWVCVSQNLQILELKKYNGNEKRAKKSQHFKLSTYLKCCEVISSRVMVGESKCVLQCQVQSFIEWMDSNTTNIKSLVLWFRFYAMRHRSSTSSDSACVSIYRNISSQKFKTTWYKMYHLFFVEFYRFSGFAFWTLVLWRPFLVSPFRGTAPGNVTKEP